MRVVRSAAELDDALAAAQREAEAAFGDGTVFCERYLERPRHVEAQLLGHAAASRCSATRDCSVQRRHQKLVEESPASASTRRPGRGSRPARVAFAEAIGYESAGTAEFLVDGPDVYFLELNGRIQVEHPVTEAVTGLDIVELQLRVAAGEPVELDVAARVTRSRRACTPRIRSTFLPQAGHDSAGSCCPPAIRVDAGVEEGDEIGLSYDPMIAKLIAHGADRDDAIARLELALDATVVEGVTTNLPFLRWLVRHPGVPGRRRLDGVSPRARAALGSAAARRHRPRSRTRGG